MSSAAIRTARVAPRLARHRSVRPALERWLGEADPARHGLPAGAIVVLRRLRSAWPQVIHAEACSRYAVLAEAIAAAARPARGERSDQAVWFADEAELLACLARDALAGELAARWWWPLLLPQRSVDAARARWTRGARAAPRALARMPAPTASAWLACWPEPQRVAFVRALARWFPVAAPVRAWIEEGESRAPPEVAVSRAPLPSPARDPPATQRPHERLLALCVAIARDARSGEAVPPLRGAAMLAGAPAARGEVRSRPVAAGVKGQGTATRRPRGRTTAPAARRPQPPTEPDRPEHDTRAASHPTTRPPRHVEPSPAAAASLPDAPAPPATRPVEHAPALPMRAAPPASSGPIALPSASAQDALATDFAGALFLLNAALQMGLYGDFTEPLRPGLACSPWRFLLAAGSALAGRAFARDPLAPWLRARDAALARPRRPWRRACAALVHAECERLGLRIDGDPQDPWRALRARLAAALDLAPRTAGRTLLRLPGRIVDAGDRLDVRIALADLPIRVRLAGLDRDPGWIPAAGCDVRFRFA